MSASDSFHTLLQKIAPDETQRQKVAVHRDTIAGRLRAEFAMYKQFAIGSFSRGTDLAGHSDVDLFAVFSKDAITWGGSVKSSFTMLDNVRVALEGRLPYTSIRRDVHAIVVAFASGVEVDVVPAYFAGMTANGQYPTYGMPDGTGGWMRVSPTRMRHTYQMPIRELPGN